MDRYLRATVERQEDLAWRAVAEASDTLHLEAAATSLSARRASQAALRAEQRSTLATRAIEKAAARAIRDAPREHRPPWEWLPQPGATATAAQLRAALAGSLLVAPGLSAAQAFVGEVGEFPQLRRMREAECAADLRDGLREARLLAGAGGGEEGVFAAALRARDLALLEAGLIERSEAAAAKAARLAATREEVSCVLLLLLPIEQIKLTPPTAHKRRLRQRLHAQSGCVRLTRRRCGAQMLRRTGSLWAAAARREAAPSK